MARKSCANALNACEHERTNVYELAPLCLTSGDQQRLRQSINHAIAASAVCQAGSCGSGERSLREQAKQELKYPTGLWHDCQPQARHNGRPVEQALQWELWVGSPLGQ